MKAIVVNSTQKTKAYKEEALQRVEILQRVKVFQRVKVIQKSEGTTNSGSPAKFGVRQIEEVK